MHSQWINSTVLHRRQLFCTKSGGRRFEHLGQTSHYPQNILIMRQIPRNVDQASQTWHSICHARSISRQARMPSSALLGQRHSETCKIADFRAFRSIYHSKWGKHRPRELLAHTRPTTFTPVTPHKFWARICMQESRVSCCKCKQVFAKWEACTCRHCSFSARTNSHTGDSESWACYLNALINKEGPGSCSACNVLRPSYFTYQASAMEAACTKCGMFLFCALNAIRSPLS